MISKTTTILVIILSHALFYGCSKTENSNQESKTNQSDQGSVTLRETSTETFKLDTLTAPTSQSVHYFKQGNSYYLSIMGKNDNSIVIFNDSTKKIEQKIPLLKEGPNALGRADYLGQYVINKDSIILVNEWTSVIYLINGKGEILYKKMVPRDQKTREGLMAKTVQPIFYKDNTIYMSYGCTGLAPDYDSKRNTVYILNLKNSQTEIAFPRTNAYKTGKWWGAGLFDYVYTTYNPELDKFIYSFPVDPFIYETNYKSEPIKHEAGSNFFSDVKPMAQAPVNDNDYEQSVEYDYTTSRYYRIIYDPYRKYYYRFTLLGNTKEQLLDPAIAYQQRETIIILNSKFEKIGEHELPRGRYDSTNFYVNKNGLCLLLSPNQYEDEDDMIYGVLTPENLLQ